MDQLMPIGADVATWAVKDFSVELRELIVRAAKRHNCTVAEFLHAYFQRHGLEGQQFEIVRPPEERVIPHAPIEDICRLTEAAARFAETADAMPKGLRASLSRGLREAARERVPPRPKQPQPKALAAPETEPA